MRLALSRLEELKDGMKIDISADRFSNVLQTMKRRPASPPTHGSANTAWKNVSSLSSVATRLMSN